MTMVVVETKTIVPFPPAPHCQIKDGLSADNGDARSGVLVPPARFHGCHVLGQLPKSVHSLVHPGINSTQNKATWQSPGAKTESLVSRSSGATTRAVTQHKAKSNNQLTTHQRAQGSSHVHLNIIRETASSKSATKNNSSIYSRPVRSSAIARNDDPLARQKKTNQTRSHAPSPKHKVSGPGDPCRRIEAA